IDALIRSGQPDAARQVILHGRERGLQCEAVDAMAVLLDSPASKSDNSTSLLQHARTANEPTINRKQRRAAEKKVKQPIIKTGQLSQPPESVAPRPLPAPSSAEIDHLIALYNQCRYTDVELFARSLIERFPQHGFGWTSLGAVLKQMGRSADALAPLEKAAVLSPRDADVFFNLGLALHDLGRLENAETRYQQALQIRPDYAEAHCSRGTNLNDLGRLVEAEASFRRALEIRPDFAEAHNNLAITLKSQCRLDEAEACYRHALLIRPDYADAHYNLGGILRDLGRVDEAETSYSRVLALRDWKSTLLSLTTPIVLLTGLVQGSQETVNFTGTGSKATGGTESRSGKNLRIILIYPPPWQMSSSDDSTVCGMPFGPPIEGNKRILDGDFQIITYGLLTIAAQAKRAGYDVTVYNLSTSLWQDVVHLIANTEADVYGISAFTANRRGMGAVAALIRLHHPAAHITVGGPFVTALPLDTLRHYQDIDTAVIGEGEETFMELLDCLGAGRPATGIPGTAWRDGEQISIGPPRSRINDLDSLASPFDYFTSPIVMTSRGCPSNCTFCGSFTTWGKKLRFHSASFCLDIFRKALARLPVPFIMIKDDTFTADRRRTIAICDAIIENKMNFIWSCDTRVDSLDDELLSKMRLAGCQMISLGVESGSPAILKAMRKKTTPGMVLEATRSARKYGMHVRYYMIFLNRGETAETIQQSIDLIKAGRPGRYFFSHLSFYPGTEEWAILSGKEGLTTDIFFRNDFLELSVATNRQKVVQDFLLQVVSGIGAADGFDYTLDEREAVAERLPNVHSVHVELANAYLRAGRLDDAESALNRAEQLGFPIGSLICNQRACIALARNEYDKALALLEHVIQSNPSHIVLQNFNNLRAWVDAPARGRGNPPLLNDSVLAIDFSPLQPHSDS
ncbi:MAG: tetratricopeptide repeat protein, partial [Deltaproteobacteria bacterium]